METATDMGTPDPVEFDDTDGLNDQDETAAEAIGLVIDAFLTMKQLSTPLETARTGMVATAWTIRVLRTAEAVVQLYRAGLGDAAAPLVRSVMEHAISLAWLSERQEAAVDAIEFHHRRHQRLLYESVGKGGWDLGALEQGDDPHPMNAPMDRPDEWPKMKSVEQRFGASGTATAYAAYRLESALSHATYLSGATYVRGPDNLAFSWEPVVPVTPLRGTAVFVVVAVEALADLTEVSEELREAVRTAKPLIGLT